MKDILFLKLNALFRAFLLGGSSNFIPQILVSEYPKSGGSWFCQMLSECLDIPFPRNTFPKLTTNIMHGHHLYRGKQKRSYCIIRDGRDIMVSYYYHCLFENEKQNGPIVKRHKSILSFKNPSDIKTNLPVFIKHQMATPIYPRFNWPQFVDSWIKQQNVCFIRYEDLLSKPLETMKYAASYADTTPTDVELIDIINRYSFKAQTDRNAGEQVSNSFLRKGIAGDWKNHFTRESGNIFCQYAGETLIELGFEKDTNWVKQL